MFDESNEIQFKVGISLVCLFLAGKFDNHFWRIVVVVIHHVLTSFVGESSMVGMVLRALAVFGIIWMPMFANFKYMKRKGCVMITGCDSGMGQATVEYLAKSNDDPKKGSYEKIFAACFNPKASREAFEKMLTPGQMKHVIVVSLDVTDDKSCQDAAKTIQTWITENPSKGLYGIVQYHGIAFNGPAAYMPIELYERQFQVNFLGNLRVVQNFLPILKQRADGQGRVVFTGTGGGSCSPCPPLLSAYMASKFATEAYCQSLRAEMYMTGANIECAMINPGFGTSCI
jgi:NAD(P)-dependent dehydrogenase (short-subunit alcohol dehydrogenase family)